MSVAESYESPRLPSGIVTFVLTDIEESTRLWDADPDSMAAALIRHDEMVGALTRSGGGALIKSKGEGDATLGVFPRASSAVSTALDVQRAVAAERWPGNLDLRVRIALHTGEAYERDGDYYGPTLNRAARLRSLARGGQILLSHSTAEVVVDRLPAAATLTDLGHHELRGMARHERVFQLWAPGLPFAPDADRPEAPSAEPTTSVLPTARAGSSDSHFSDSRRHIAPLDSWTGSLPEHDESPHPHAMPRRDEPAPDAVEPMPLPAGLETAPQAFLVGRETESAQLADALRLAALGHRRAVLLGGEPGIGKTALVGNLARQAHGLGARVLYGHCDEELGLAYQPFAEALGHYVVHCPVNELMDHVVSHGAGLARLVPELSRRVPESTPPPATDPEADRFLMFEAVTALLDRASRAAPVVLVLEDLHWATNTTLLMLRHLLRCASGARLLVVGTYRHTEIDLDHPLTATLADLRRLPGVVERIQLGGLSTAEVGSFVAAAAGGKGLAGHAGPTLANALYAHTAGNPFFIGEMLRHLVETGQPCPGTGNQPFDLDRQSLAVPQSVREVVSLRLRRLSPMTNATLTMASVIGSTFNVEVLEQVVDGADADGVLDALEEGVAAQVLVELGHGGYQFSHALVRETIYSGLTSTRRDRHHRRVGEALESMGDGGQGYYLPALAYHFAEAAPAGCALKAADYAMAAARNAVSQAAWEDAIALLQRGLKSLEAHRPPDLARQCELLLQLAEAWTRFFSPPQALTTARDAVVVARTLGSPDRLGRGTYWYVRAATGTGDPQDMSEATELAEEALAVLGEALPAIRSKILAVLARIQDTRGQSSESTSRQAMALARSCGDPEALGVALLTATGFVGSLHPRERLALAEELVSAAPPDGWDGWRDGHSQRAMARLTLGDRGGFEEDVAACERLGVERRFWFFRWIGALWRATLALMDGRFGEVEALAGHAREITLQDPYRLLTSVQLFRLHLELGNMTDAKAVVAGALDDLPTNPILRTMHALVLAESGAREEATEEYEEFADDQCAGVPWPLRPIAMAYRSELVLALHDHVRARWLYDEFRPYAGQLALSGVASTCVGAVDRYLGMLASAMNQWAAAERHFHAAVALEAGLASPPTAARTAYWYGRMLLKRGAAGDLAKVQERLAYSRRTAEHFGMAGLSSRARDLCTSGDQL